MIRAGARPAASLWLWWKKADMQLTRLSDSKPIAFECWPWEIKLLLRLRQMRNGGNISHLLIDVQNMQLFPVGGVETLDKPSYAQPENSV